MQTHRTVVGMLMVTAVAMTAGCGSGGSAGPAHALDLPTAADTVVVRVDTRGGFTSAGYQFSLVPQLTVYGDGRVVVSGPVTEQYPPHALPNLLTGTLPRAEVERLARLAGDLGLLRDGGDYGRPGVTDLPTTTVTIAADGTHRHAAYALDFSGTAAPGLTAAQRGARQRLTRFTRAVGTAVDRIATEPFTAREVAISIAAAGPADDTGGVTPGVAEWPLADLGTIGHGPSDPAVPMPSTRCVVLTGADAATALAAAADATSITRWRSAGAGYTIAWRPLLPDEHACPDGS